MTPMAPAPVSPAPRPVSPAPPFRTTVTITPSPSGDPGPAQQPAPLGSRSNWPLVSGADDLSSEPVMANLAPDPILGDPYAGSPPRHNGTPVNGVASLDSGRPVDIGAPADPSRRPVERVTPPWQADDLPPEPPTLRLVEPPPLPDPALTGFGDVLGGGDQHLGSRPLRLVEEAGPDRDGRNPTRSGARPGPAPVAVPPVADDDSDADLLIFAAARSAWFTGQESEEGWGVADAGWRAAEQAARPSIGTPTNAGLPKRVPQANLVPGSALNEAERPLRIVRDAASIAEHTSGYFQGWRRGQQIGGYAVGGRPGRESAQGWDFSRDPGDHEYDEESPYRAAGGHRSR